MFLGLSFIVCKGTVGVGDLITPILLDEGKWEIFTLRDILVCKSGAGQENLNYFEHLE